MVTAGDSFAAALQACTVCARTKNHAFRRLANAYKKNTEPPHPIGKKKKRPAIMCNEPGINTLPFSTRRKTMRHWRRTHRAGPRPAQPTRRIIHAAVAIGACSPEHVWPGPFPQTCCCSPWNFAPRPCAAHIPSPVRLRFSQLPLCPQRR